MDNIDKIGMLPSQGAALSSGMADLRARVVKLEAAQASDTAVLIAGPTSGVGTLALVKVK